MPIELIDIIKPKNNAQFPMVEDIDFKGGYRTVQDIIHRDAVPSANRKPNMLVYTQNEDKLWRWGAPWIDNTSWIEIPLGGAGSGVVGEQGLTNRRVLLDITTSVPIISDFREETAIPEIKSVAILRTWVPDAYTITTVDFTMPAIHSNTTITLLDATAYSILTTPAQILFVDGAGYFRVDGVSGNDIDGYNFGTYNGFTPNAAPSTVITAGSGAHLPFGNFGDSILYGQADGSAFAYDEFSASEAFSAGAGSSGLSVIATRDLIISGGTQSGNTKLIRRHATSGTIISVSGPPGTLAGGSVITGPGFDNFPTIKRTIGQWVWFSSPSDGYIYAYGLDTSPAIIQANLNILTKPHGMVIADDGFIWLCDRMDDTSANATLTQYLPLSSGILDATALTTISGFLAQSQIVYTGRFIFGLDCSDGYAAINRFDLQTKNVDTYTLSTVGTPDRSSIYFDGIGLWVTTGNTVYRIDPSNYGIQYSYTDPVSTIDYGVMTATPSGTSILIAFINTNNSNVGVRKFAFRKTIDTDRLRITSIGPNANVITNANGELISGEFEVPLDGDVTGLSGANQVAKIQGVVSPVASIGDDTKSITYDELNNRYILKTVGSPIFKSSTVSAGVINTIDIEGQNAPMIAPDIGSGSIIAFHKPPFGHDSSSMQPAFRWPSRARGMEIYFASSTATDLVFTDGYLAVVHSSISDFPITLHDPASGQIVSRLPISDIGSSGWDSIYFVTQEAIIDGTAPKDPYLYLQKSGTNELARINMTSGDFDLISSPSSVNGPIYVHESGTIAWMAGGSLVYTAAPCDTSVPTIQTSSLTGKDSDAASSLVVVPSVYNVSFSQSGLIYEAWITQPLSKTLIHCDFPFGTNDGYINYNDSAGHTRPRQIVFDGTYLIVNAMNDTYPGDASTLGVISRIDPVNMLFADSDDNTQGCSFDGSLIVDGKFAIASDTTKTLTDISTNNEDAIHIRSTDFPIVSSSNGKARMGGLRIEHPSKLATARNGSPFFGLYAICNASIPGIYRYLDRPSLFTYSINLAGGFIDHIERVDGYYNVSSFDSTVVMHDLVGDIVLTLPSNPVLGQTFIFVDEDGSLGTWSATIDGNGNDINGSPVYIMGGTLLLARQAITVKWTGNSWCCV